MKKAIYYFSLITLVYFGFGGIMYLGGKGVKVKGLATIVSAPVGLIFETMRSIYINGIEEFSNGHLYESKVKTQNNLKENLFILNTVKNNNNDSIEILNLKTSKIVYKMGLNSGLEVKNIRSRLLPSLSIQNKILAVYVGGTGSIAAYSTKSKKPIWSKNFKNFEIHHRIHVQGDNIYCNIRKIEKLKGNEFYNEGFAVIDLKKGNLIKTWWVYPAIEKVRNFNSLKGIKDINGIGFTQEKTTKNDYFHFNDVQPVMGDFAEGDILRNKDILLSSRNLSAVFQIRGDSIINIIQGKFNLQHDVDVIDGNHVMVFNNNASNFTPNYPWLQKTKSNIVIKNLKNGKDSICFDEYALSSATGGQHENNGEYYFIENQNQHEILVFKNNILQYRGELRNSFDPSKVNLLNWCQILSEKEFKTIN